MPVLSKFCGIVVVMLFARQLGARFHAFYKNSEMVVGLQPLRIIESDAPYWVCELVLSWAAQHEFELLEAWNHCGIRKRPNAIPAVNHG